MATIIYSSSRGVGDFTQKIEEKEKETFDGSTLENLRYAKDHVIKYFNFYSGIEIVKYQNIILVNSDVNTGSFYTIPKKIEYTYISSHYDWILVLMLIVALIIVLISIIDYCFVSKRKYDIRWYNILNF